MGKSVVRVSGVKKEKIERLGFGAGLQFFAEPREVKGPYCQYGAYGECDGVNDLDYVRCSVLNCEECLIYQIKEQEKDEKSDDAIVLSNPLEDTVIMHGDNIVSKNSYDDSVHDQISDGADIRKFFGIRHALRTGSIDYRVD